MADEKPEVTPSDESKKDTVRINLPPGLAGKTAAPAAGGAPTVKLRPTPVPTPAAAPEEESKKETAVMGMPVATPQPKKDTSRVQVPAAKPAVPETPRPTVRLKREEPIPAAAPATPAAPVAPPPAAKAAPAPGAAVLTGLDVGLAVGVLVLSLAVAGYLYNITMYNIVTK